MDGVMRLPGQKAAPYPSFPSLRFPAKGMERHPFDSGFRSA